MNRRIATMPITEDAFRKAFKLPADLIISNVRLAPELGIIEFRIEQEALEEVQDNQRIPMANPTYCSTKIEDAEVWVTKFDKWHQY